MVTTNRKFRRTIIKLSVAAFTFASIGAAVAAPLFVQKKVVLAKTEIGQLRPLAGGPAIQLAKAGPGEAEDCVRVTRMIGPDGKEVPTFGMVCGGN